MQLENQCPMSIVYPDQYRIVVHPDKLVWSTIIVWSCALVAGPKITALEVGRTFAVSDATSSVVVAIARVIAIAIARVVSIAKTWVVSVAIVVSRIVPLTSVVAGESAIAIIARISASRRPLSPPVVGRAAARLVVVVVEATVVVVAVVASVGKVTAGAAGATAALCKIPVISALAPVTAPPTIVLPLHHHHGQHQDCHHHRQRPHGRNCASH